MAELTAKERQWVKKLQKVLDECPSSLKNRGDSYTIGDADITIFDKHIYTDRGNDVGVDVDDSDAELAKIIMPFGVASTCG